MKLDYAARVGDLVGLVGLLVGDLVGLVGLLVGDLVGLVGLLVGTLLDLLGDKVGAPVGTELDGLCVDLVGANEGDVGT